MNVNKSSNILYYLLLFIIFLFVLVIGISINNSKKIIKYDDIKVNMIIDYLTVDSVYYDGIVNDVVIGFDGLDFNEIDNIYINKQIASYVIKNVNSNDNYGISDCSECYKYFSEDDDIKFYDVDDIDSIYRDIFGEDFKRINQDDYEGFNIIYYNENIDKYYINIAYNGDKPLVISECKKYGYDSDIFYIDYYYFKVEYDTDSNNINLYNIDNIFVSKLLYDDLFDDNDVLKINNYINYFDVVRYEFKYDYSDKMYVLNKLFRMEN